MLVWPRVRDGNYDIALLDLETGEETPLTTSPLEDSFPVLTHDRRTIIYSQVTEQGLVLRVMGADGRGDRELLSSLAGGLRRRGPTRDDARRPAGDDLCPSYGPHSADADRDGPGRRRWSGT